MTRNEALAIVHEFIKNENLVKHMLSVEAAMRFYAKKLDQDIETWGLLGLPLALKMVNQMGGHLQIRNREKTGVTAEVTLKRSSL